MMEPVGHSIEREVMMGNKSIFDEVIDRQSTHCLKWDGIEERFGLSDDELLPMWVADMDFKVSDAIVSTLQKRLDHGVFGYVADYGHFQDLAAKWITDRHGWQVDPDWIVFSDGIVKALHHIVNGFTGLGDKIIIQPPVYPPFYDVVEKNGRTLVTNHLKEINGCYQMDFEDLEQKMRDGATMLILCSPHNPVGRVWSGEELSRLADLCIKYDVLVVSDEIHADIVYSGYQHTPFGSVSEALQDRCIVCMSPSKSFNIAGLEMSNIVIPSGPMRRRFVEERDRRGLVRPNAFGLAAAIGAYTGGHGWIDEVTRYIEDNYKYLKDYIEDKIPQIRVTPAQGTFLVWLNVEALEFDDDKLKRFMFEHAKLVLNFGKAYGKGSSDYIRMNVACPRPVLEEGLNRLKKGVTAYLEEEMKC